MLSGILHESAVRICRYTGRPTAMKVYECSKKSLTCARAVFIVFLSIDSVLRECVAKGDLGELEGAKRHRMAFQAVCPYKAERLFLAIKGEVIAPWIRHTCNTVSQLVDSFEREYLCS